VAPENNHYYAVLRRQPTASQVLFEHTENAELAMTQQRG
jgi:hypothetical protein